MTRPVSFVFDFAREGISCHILDDGAQTAHEIMLYASRSTTNHKFCVIFSFKNANSFLL